MNFDTPPVPEKGVEIEKIVSGAIRYKEEIFTGQFHADAAVKIWEKYPETEQDMSDFEEGFLTSAGRFVDRKEAGEIAKKSRQLDHLDLAERAYAIDNLDCEDIEGEQPDKNSEKKESIDGATLESPAIQYKESFLEALEEFQQQDGKYTYLDREKLEADFEAYIKDIPATRMEINQVPETEYWLVDKDQFIGRLSIRHELNEELLLRGGHIGYAIRPSERQKGYGVKILELGLEKAKLLGFTRVLVTCDSTNIASRKIIENHGGILENEVEGKPGEPTVLRFWIDTNAE